jgi:hypothetical protein
MLTDQYGMAGLLTGIRSAETNPDLLELSNGFDVTSHLDSDSGLIWPTFDGPWSDLKTARPQDIDFEFKPEYQMNSEIR